MAKPQLHAMQGRLDPLAAPRRVSILGATGSIGQSTRSVILENRSAFEVDAVVGGSDAEALARIAIELGAKAAVISDDAAYEPLKAALAGTGIAVAAGRQAVNEAAQRPVDRVIAAITGIAGLAPTLSAALAGQTIALANKETLVSGGAMFMAAAARCGATILPLDSEHNSLFQALGANPVSSIEKMILTASGGPFREWSADRLASAKREQALAHPNYA
ncbi:MAG: 1-deoxy-D-xylulose-5-phosphate reductoisomerase, partial [Beijerinckiaceae bacterium]|nr:1-deoxy-D-xylulose-5-phosphate reductoisomerase [Beijerinckiaceae bacterium]